MAEWGSKLFCNSLVLSTLDFQSLGPSSMLQTELCLFFVSLSPVMISRLIIIKLNPSLGEVRTFNA